ncbi:GntR family transcriptional regulator [Altericroceibacterium spongiae]|uniref:GntR family transcriptional regulator n=1 Tax=Altericroceibacterium spongiae TaxID=2320269 RepID=A0A420EJ01_9SPHN|nr:GntR family transcriptional regulator [Altericroceibacterium spongiae]RKF20536.1 GntR family transcriptional regulator [Altericroceibacterium spongiae]
MSRASEKAYEYIRTRILSGEIKPRTQLKEEDLAKMCGVSRTPVREALRRLEADMLVLRTDTQRSFVPVWSDEEVGEIFELRAMLEGHAAERAAMRATPEQIARLREINDRIKQAILAEPADFDGFVTINREFHDYILEIADSPRLCRLVALLVEQPVLQRTALRYGIPGLHRSHAGHDEIMQAFEVRDGAWAKHVMQSHIRQAFHATLIEDENGCHAVDHSDLAIVPISTVAEASE